MRKRNLPIKQWLVLCFSFALAALTVCTIYVNSIDENNHRFHNEKTHAQPVFGSSNSKGIPKTTEGKRNDTKTLTNGVQNGSLSAQMGNHSLVKVQDAHQGNNGSVSGKSKNNTGVIGTGVKPVPRDGQLFKNETPDPLYDHPGYISVLDPKKKLNLHCTQCAYVSSSGQLLQSRVGYLIDEADCVFRMNDAPVPTYEEDVGSRTTVRVVGHAATYNLKNKRQYLLQESSSRYVVGWGPAKVLQTNGKGYAYNNLKEMAKRFKQVNFFHLTQDQMKKADEIFEAETGRPRLGSGTFLSTGWFTMVLARQACDEIHVYGMISEDYCQSPNHNNVPYHYYDPRGKKECSYYQSHEKGKKGFHRFITEKSVFAHWAHEQPPIFFHVPDWNP